MKKLFLFLTTIIALASCKDDQESMITSNDSLIVYFTSNRTGNYEIWMKKDNSITQVTNDKRFDSWWPRISP